MGAKLDRDRVGRTRRQNGIRVLAFCSCFFFFIERASTSCRDHLLHTTHIHIQVLDLQPAQRELPSQRTRNLRPHAGPVAALRPCFGSGTQLPSVLRQAPLSSVPVKVHSIAAYCCN